MQEGICGAFRKGKRNSTDDVSYSQIKYEVPACKRILVACKNELIPK